MRSADIEYMQELARILDQDYEYLLDGTLLYAVVDTNYVAASIFKDWLGVTYYRDPNLDGLADTLLDLWESYPPGERWEEIEYVIRDGRFDVSFNYPKDILPDEEPFQRRNAIVAKYFGTQPIRYPPSPGYPEGRLVEYRSTFKSFPSSPRIASAAACDLSNPAAQTDEIAAILRDIGKLLARDTEYPLDGTLFFVVCADGLVRPSIFKDRGPDVIYRQPDMGVLTHRAMDLWEAFPDDKRWVELEYFIQDGKFNADFNYADSLDPENDDWGARRDEVIAKYFGDKPVFYPPWRDDDEERLDYEG